MPHIKRPHRPLPFAPGETVRHIANLRERYQLILVLQNTAWGIRKSDGVEVMLYLENLTRYP
jgi:hypothetical protein